MGLFKSFRQRATEKYMRELGAHRDVAELAAVAMHPFVTGSPKPESSAFINAVRSDSHAFTRAVRSVRTAKELHDLARPVVFDWVTKASLLGEDQCREEFLPILNAALRAAEPPPEGTVPGRTRTLAEVIEDDPEMQEWWDNMMSDIDRKNADPHELARPSRRLAMERMDAAAAAGVPEVDIQQGEQDLAQMEGMIASLTPAERRGWLGNLDPRLLGMGMAAIESLEADEEAGYAS